MQDAALGRSCGSAQAAVGWSGTVVWALQTLKE